MSEPRAVRVLSDDRKSNLSAEVWNAFDDELESVVERDRGFAWLDGVLGRRPLRTTTTVGGTGPSGSEDGRTAQDEERGTEADPGPPGETLSRRQVEHMLNDPADWKVAVSNGGSYEVLHKGTLAHVWQTSDSFTPTVVASQASGGEAAVLKWQEEDLQGDAGQVDKALAAPITAVAGIGTILGGYGLLGTDSVHKPLLLVLAIVVGLVAIALAWRPTVDLRTYTVRPGRLDEAETRYRESLSEGTRRSWLPAVVLAVAALLAILALALPDGASPSTAIAVSDAGQTSEGVQAQVTVTWKDMAESATLVETTVTTADGQRVALRRTRKGADGGVKQEFPVTVPEPGAIEVRTKAVGNDGKRVGVESAKSFDVP